MPVLGYARKIVFENEGKHLSGSTALVYLPRLNGGRGLRSVGNKYKVTNIKAAIKMYEDKDAAMIVVLEFG